MIEIILKIIVSLTNEIGGRKEHFVDFLVKNSRVHISVELNGKSNG